MATSVGTITVDARLNGANFSAGIEDLNSQAKAFTDKAGSLLKDGGSKIVSGLTTAAKASAAAIGAATAAITVQAAKNYSDYQQMTGGIQKLFGDAAQTVIANSENAYKTAGMSANAYMETVTNFSATLVKGLGGDTAKAAGIADQAVQDMSDNANTFGTSMESIQYAYQGFAKQNYTMLDNLKLGYGGTAAEMARLVNDSGVMGANFQATAKNINDVSFDKIIEAIHVTQERLNIAGTTAKEAGGTIEGSLNQMKSAWTNWTTALAGGGDIKSTTSAMMQSIEQFAGNILPVLEKVIPQIIPTLSENIIPGLLKMAKDLAPTLATMMAQVAIQIAQALPAVIQAITTTITNPTILQQMTQAAITLFMALVQAIPQIAQAVLGALPMIIDTLTQPDTLAQMIAAAVQLFIVIVQAIPQIIDALIAALPQIINTLTRPDVLAQMLTAGIALWTQMVLAVPRILGALIGAIGSLLRGLWNNVKGLFGDLGSKAGQAIGGALKGAINGAIATAEGLINNVIGLINGALGAINKIPGVNIKKLNNVKFGRLASGGLVTGVGTATSDSNPYMLSRGEYVVRAKAVDLLGKDTLDEINKGRLPAYGAGAGNTVQNFYYQFDKMANSRWQYQQVIKGAAI